MAEIPHSGLHDWTSVVRRRSRLRHAGFDARLAERLAADVRYDLQAVFDLVDRGCPPHLAARICTPLDLDADA